MQRDRPQPPRIAHPSPSQTHSIVVGPPAAALNHPSSQRISAAAAVNRERFVPNNRTGVHVRADFEASAHSRLLLRHVARCLRTHAFCALSFLTFAWLLLPLFCW